ncbi:hypothetical protein FEM48_Zijuj05G0022100 [Ziziphus jujuba var. spinosa]|uniref:Leucine-rich repeat-containing N-terminal plant-type domain-containing protein n=1 Tax=Ziziphus jujuba var. spinosa TaxID=714518 RepID=A0A978VC78_ZIZJJ|nr:hypothetical protein FEM48_Zijuj05G0022100 [Ziziphus jujuba var. spinosa]
MMKTASMFQLMLLILFFTRREFVRFGDAQLAECLESDRVALVAFKNGLNDPENRLSSWKGSNCCQWRGISCESSTGAVIAVDLHNPYPQGFDSSSRYGFWNLSGEIKPSMMKLKSLRYLDLSFNTFNDNPIPEFFGSLKNLQYLNLSNAEFSGAIPPNLGNLSSLQYLDLKYSPSLYVENLEWLKGLVSLKHLLMREVDLSMVGSNWVRTINKLPSLTEGSYYEENLVVNMKGQPQTYTKILSLVISLDLSGNNLSGDLPREITKLLGLVVLNLSGNHITGHIPESISELKQLLSLDLSSNRLSGPVPQSLGTLSFLGYLNLSYNDLSGRIPYTDHMTTFDAASFTGNLGLCGGPLAVKCPGDEDDEEPDGESKNLTKYSRRKLKGGFCPNTDALLMNCLESDQEALLDFKNGLYDPENRLSSWKGSNCCQWWGISCESNTGAVIAVDLHNPYPQRFHSSSRYGFWNLSGEIRPSLTKLKSLRHLDLSLNTFDGNKIPEFLGSLKNLQYLNLSNAGFSGAIPLTLGNLSGLQYLDVESWSSYVDNLEWVTGLVSLEHLVMNGVNLSMFRTYTKTLSLLTSLDLSGNNLSGGLPIEITKLLGLVVMNLSRNHISGYIPESISELKQLSSLDLSSNEFSGVIPRSLGLLSFLGFLNLSKNNLSGRIPYSDHLSTFDAPSFAGNLGLCGTPLAVKCPGDDEEDSDSDREALIDFKNRLHDPENQLFSWKGSNRFQCWGISWDSNAGAVIAVDLHNPHLHSLVIGGY